ncbi:hypothetical protein HY251_18495 [bacterium]|nr:hypothetical protein [bacterium]
MVFRRCLGIGLATVGGLALAGSLVGGDRLRLYGATGERLIQEKLERVEGLQTKIELLKTEIQNLDGEVVRLENDCTARRVEVDRANARLHESEQSIERQRRVLARAAELLDEGRSRYEISGHVYDRAAVEDDARRKLEACRAAERSLEDEKHLVAIRERTLELARAHMDRVQKRKGELVTVARSIEARIAQQEAKHALADALDAPPISAQAQSELAKAERLAKDVAEKLEVEERMLDERLAKKEGPVGTIDYETRAAEKVEDASKAIKDHLAGKTATPAPAPAPAPAPSELH